MTVKERIIEEASELFGRSGVKSITMDDIARHLGISKRTIYEKFKDKEDLLISCIDAFHNKKSKHQKDIFLNANNVAEACLVLQQMSADQTTQMQLNMMNDIRKYYPQVYKEHLSRFHIDECHNMEQLIQRGINEGVFRDNINPEIIAHYFSKQGESIVHNDKDLEKFPLSEIFENIAITFMRGLCTIKGIEIIDNYKMVSE